MTDHHADERLVKTDQNKGELQTYIYSGYRGFFPRFFFAIVPVIAAAIEIARN